MATITVEQLQHLSFAEKLQLVEDLWDSIAAEAAAQPVSEELKLELQRRLDEHHRHPETSESWETARAELERRLP